jgi:cysteine desulfurase
MIKPPRCYLDNNATTRVAPEVIEAMVPFLTEGWGNPSSAYTFGHALAEHVDAARADIAALLGAEPRELVFTSCGTESINTAIHTALATQPDKRHLITTAVEHSSTLNYCSWLTTQGYQVSYLPVNSEGALDISLLENSIRPDTALVSIMWANNETGILFPVDLVAELCHRRGVMLHVDAVQVGGKLPIDLSQLRVNLLSISGHKLHGPKGVGVLYIKRHTRFKGYVIGGGQERARRGGTENVPAIVGFGRAARLALQRSARDHERVRMLRDKLEAGILARIPGTSRNAPAEPRLPNTTNIAFDGVEAEGVLLLLDQVGICASSGSACTTGSLDPSHVLRAMGMSNARARGSIRFSLGAYTTEAEIDYALEALPKAIGRLREHLPPVVSPV